MNVIILLLALLCHVLPLMFHYVGESAAVTAKATLDLSRASCIIMLVMYFAYLVFQLWTHRQFFEAQEVIIIPNFLSFLVKCIFDCPNNIANFFLALLGRRWWWCGWGRKTCNWVLKRICLASRDDCSHSIIVWICSGHYWGN